MPKGVYAVTKLESEQVASGMEEAPHRADLRPLCPAFASDGPQFREDDSAALRERSRNCGWWTTSRARRATCRTWPGRSFICWGATRRARTGALGNLHVTNHGETTWFGFAREIVRLAGLEVPVEPITTAEFAAAAPRPAYSVLDTTAYDRLGGPACRTGRKPWASILRN